MGTEFRIGRLEPSMMEESLRLSEFAFQFTLPPDRLESVKEQMQEEPADYWAVLDGETIAAQATVLGLQVYVGGKVLEAGGVASVATWPEYRRKGLVAELLTHSLQEMRARGQVLSMLHPFAVGFYRKFGWEVYTDNKKYVIKSSQLPPRVAYPGKIERRGSHEGLAALYDTYASRYNGTIARTPIWWKHRVAGRKKGQIAVYVDAQGKEQGYLLYDVKDMRMTVHELVALNLEAETAIWSFIAQHDSMMEEVTITVPADDTYPDRLPNPRISQEIFPYFMARIVDVEALLVQYPFLKSTRTDRFQLRISDRHAPWNNRTLGLIVDAEGTGVVVPEGESTVDTEGQGNVAAPGESAAGSIIDMDIAAFTALLLGYRKGMQLSASGRITGDAETINRLQTRIPEQTPWLPDFF